MKKTATGIRKALQSIAETFPNISVIVGANERDIDFAKLYSSPLRGLIIITDGAFDAADETGSC